MTSRKMVLGLAAAAVLALSAGAGATPTLTHNGDGTITDDDRGIMWLQNANLAGPGSPFQLTDAQVDAIIAAVGSVDGHALTTSDFIKEAGVYKGRMTWWGAKAWAESLVFAGYDDWRLPSALNADGTVTWDYGVSGSEMGHLYNVHGLDDFQNVAVQYWLDTEHPLYADSAGRFRTTDGAQFAEGKGGWKNAWAVRSVSAPVPEPGTMLLLGSGLVGLIGAARRRRK